MSESDHNNNESRNHKNSKVTADECINLDIDGSQQRAAVSETNTGCDYGGDDTYMQMMDPKSFALWQREVCIALRLTGRIRVSSEGINGTIGGSRIAADIYKLAMESIPIFQGIDWKESVMMKDNVVVDGSRAFPTLHVKAVPEICALGVAPKKLRAHMGGRHVGPEEWHQMLLKKRAAEKEKEKGNESGSAIATKEYVLLDCRNWYESCIGRFEGATQLATRHFTEFPKVADKIIDNIIKKKAQGGGGGHNEEREQPTVMMYCTGGIRCERASAYLRCKGVKDVVQLRGGIHRYIDVYGTKKQQQQVASIDTENSIAGQGSKEGGRDCSSDSLYAGKNFVFDRRHAIGDPNTNTKMFKASPVIVGSCRRCNTAWDTYDKRWKCDDCNVMVLLCRVCAKTRDTQEISRRRAKKRARRQQTQIVRQHQNKTIGKDENRKIVEVTPKLQLVRKETDRETMQRYAVPLLLCELCSKKREIQTRNTNETA